MKRTLLSSVLFRSAAVWCLLSVSLPPGAAAFAEDDPTQDPKSVIKRADKLILKGRYADAEKMLRQAVDSNPNDSSLKLKLAFSLLKQRFLADAYTLSFAVAQAEKQNPYAFAVLGTTLLAAGRFADARLILSNALTLNRKEPLALASYGLLEYYENRLSSGLNYLGQAAFLEPDEPDYIFAYAQIAARAEKYREAAEHYRRFLAISQNTDDERRERILGLIDFLEYLGFRSGLYIASGADESVMPIELVGNRPVVTVTVNNRKDPLRFVLDTGSGISVVSKKTAKRMKIKPIARGGQAKGIGGDGKFEIVYGFLREIQLGSVRVRNVPVYIREFHHNVNNIDGYIGISLIAKFLTTVDYAEKTFTLKRNYDAVAAPSIKGVSLPLRLTSSGFLSGEVQLDGVTRPMNFIVDTGASVSVVSSHLARTEPLSQLPREAPLRVVGSAGITENVPSFTIPRVSFGDHSRESLTAIALDLEMINDASGFEQSGILGGNFFLNHRLTFDFKNSRLTFAAASPKN